MSIAQGSFKRLAGWLSWAAPDRLPVRLGASRATGMSSTPMRLASFDQVLVWVTVALLAWGATVALFWMLLLNTLTPLWLPIAVLGWVAAIRAARALNRESEGNSGWVILGGTWAVCVAVLALVISGAIASHGSAESGSGQGIAAPR